MIRSPHFKRAARRAPRLASPVVALLLAGLCACSTVENLAGGDKVDYRSSGTKTAGLEVPPDLTQLSRDPRYQQAGGSVSAATYQSAAAAAAPVATQVVAPAALANARIERQGTERWLVTAIAPEQLWPQLQAFWKERGFNLTTDAADAGVMETDWAENRAKLPKDLIRSTLGSLVDSIYSTGERDKFRTRVERGPAGSEIYISHRGLQEVYAGDRKETTVWETRPSDPQLEGEMLQRLLVKLGTPSEQAKTLVAAAASAPAAAASRARLVAGVPSATLQVDEGFDRAWRRVGLALDRSGFTVEDRDRGQGLYFVRYVDPRQSGKDEPGFFSRLFSFGKKNGPSGPARYRVAVKAEGERSTVSVQNGQGAPEDGDAGRRIVALLLEDLR